MIRYVIVSSKEENIKGYKQIIDKEIEIRQKLVEVKQQEIIQLQKEIIDLTR